MKLYQALVIDPLNICTEAQNTFGLVILNICHIILSICDPLVQALINLEKFMQGTLTICIAYRRFIYLGLHVDFEWV